MHVVVPEQPAAHLDPEGSARAVARTCADQIRDLLAARVAA